MSTETTDTIREETQAQYKFTLEEMGELGKALSNSRKEYAGLEGELDSIKASYKGKLSAVEVTQDNICRKLDDGFEMRKAFAIVTFNDPSKGRKTYRHEENGEFIREEAMSAADFQRPLFTEENPAELAPVAPISTGKVTQEELAQFRSLIDEAKKAYPNEDALRVVFAKVRETAPQQYGEDDYLLYVGDIRQCVEGEDPAGATVNLAEIGDQGAGQTSLGAAIDSAAFSKDAAKIVLDLSQSDWTEKGLVTAFKAAAKAAGWDQTQINAVKDALKATDTVSQMVEILRPHTIE